MGSSPTPPNPYQTASAQTNANITAGAASAAMNNANQYGPTGSRVTTQSGWQQIYDANSGKLVNVPKYDEVTKFSPDEERIYGLNTQGRYNLGQTAVEQSAKLRGLLNQNINTQGLQGWATGAAPGRIQTQLGNAGAIQRSFGNAGAIQSSFGDAGAIRQDQGPTNRAAVEAAMMGRYNTDAAKQNAAQEAQLAARGLAPGSQGWGSVREQEDRARTDALQQAYLASGQESRAAQEAYNQAQQQRYGQLQGRAQFGNEAQQQRYAQLQGRAQFGNEAQQQAWNEMLGGAQFGNAAQLQKYQMGQDYAGSLNALRQGQLQERLALRNQPINEITALMGGSQVAQPQFQPFSRQGISPANIGGYIENNYGQQAQASANRMQGLYGLGGAALTGLFRL
jgi:hypothetical protein